MLFCKYVRLPCVINACLLTSFRILLSAVIFCDSVQRMIADVLLNLSSSTDDDNLTNIYIYLLINVKFSFLSNHLVNAVISVATHCTLDSNLLLFNAFVHCLMLGLDLFIYRSILCFFCTLSSLRCKYDCVLPLIVFFLSFTKIRIV